MTAVQKSGQGTERRQRTDLLAIRLSPTERTELERRAEQAGMSVAAFVRQRTLGEAGPRSGRRIPVEAAELRKLAGQLGSVGNNLNQLTRLANLGDLERPRELDQVLSRVNAAIDECMTALGRAP